MIGGRCRLLLSGSAPINKDVLDFLRVVFCCPIEEGYGLTETAAPATITRMDCLDTIGGNVGGPIICNEIKLVDIPEMNYLTTNDTKEGEICMRGDNIFDGYYKMPKVTAEVMNDGWFSSGDVGRLLPNGAIKIIDRKKNIFKLSQGEYIAPEKLENIYSKSRYIS
jgi:long-chain acyl-CoA synthetase